MDRDRLRELLDMLKKGEASIDEVLQKLRLLPYEDIGHSKLDHHRSMRRGFPEAVFCSGKSEEQVLEIAERLLEAQGQAVLTKVSPELAERLGERFPGEIEGVPQANMVFIGKTGQRIEGSVAIVSAGTSDIPVAEEAAALCERFGVQVTKTYDVGVAGIHRLLPHLEKINSSDVIIVVAGMEGALPSIISGMTEKPLIAVPTSIGYGANFYGMAALLGMLCTCSPGTAVVNIDNGFGAGVFAISILNMTQKKKKS